MAYNKILQVDANKSLSNNDKLQILENIDYILDNFESLTVDVDDDGDLVFTGPRSLIQRLEVLFEYNEFRESFLKSMRRYLSRLTGCPFGLECVGDFQDHLCSYLEFRNNRPYCGLLGMYLDPEVDK